MGATVKTIVITGASSGIGRATALRLARNGWRVLAAVRKDEDARSIEADAQGALETVRLDVGDRDFDRRGRSRGGSPIGRPRSRRLVQQCRHWLHRTRREHHAGNAAPNFRN